MLRSPTTDRGTWEYFEVFTLGVGLKFADKLPPLPVDGIQKYVEIIRSNVREVCRKYVKMKKYVENIKEHDLIENFVNMFKIYIWKI